MKPRILFGFKEYAANNALLKINGFIDLTPTIKDTIELTIEDKISSKKATLNIDSYKLRGLHEGIYTLWETSQNNFNMVIEGYTLKLDYDENGIYIIIENKNKDTIKFFFGVFGIRSFMKTIELFCDEIEKFTYAEQRNNASLGIA